MILEGLVTTCDPDGSLHLAPMGPLVDEAMTRLMLRPFPTSQTYRNLRRHPEGVFHVTDDVLLLARAAIGRVPAVPPTEPARSVRGLILREACRAYEFRVDSIDESEPRVRMECTICDRHQLREFWGLNRARHMVVEAAILATRRHLLSPKDILAEYDKWDVIVQKTGGAAEIQAMRELRDFVLEGLG
jgi:hypothetical protein